MQEKPTLNNHDNANNGNNNNDDNGFAINYITNNCSNNTCKSQCPRARKIEKGVPGHSVSLLHGRGHVIVKCAGALLIIMENQMEKNMKNNMETGEFRDLRNFI